MTTKTYTIVHQRNGVRVYRVACASIESFTTGHWDETGDKRYTVDVQSLSERVPPNLRAAVLRCVFWSVHGAPHLPSRADLHDRNGNAMGTLYAYPDWIPEAAEAGLPQAMRGVWLPFHMVNREQRFTLTGGVVYRKHDARSAIIKNRDKFERVPFTKWQCVCLY